MPFYDYICQSCGHKFEKKEAYGEEPVTTCAEPNCQGVVVRVLQATPAIFRGGSPSKQRTVKQGKREKPIVQTEEGHWEEKGIRDRR